MRTVLSVEALGGIDPATDAERLTVRVLRSPYNVAKANVARQLMLSYEDLAAWGTPDAVRERGRKVRDSLQTHPGVATVLTQLFTTAVGGRQPLFVLLSESEGEQISWETLCDANDKFVALDPRWPIGRIIDPSTGQNRPPAELTLPLRMMVVISAFGIQGQAKEWQMLRGAIQAARKAGLPIAVKVMAGDPAVYAEIEADKAGGMADVELVPIEKTPTRVTQEIAAWKPNILHFFCHGRSELGDQSIELATGVDYANAEATGGSVKVDVGKLVNLGAELPNPWLLALNCCSSGQAGRNLQSLAQQVVDGGFPAAVAMTEPVDAADAHEFTRAFYRSLFNGIAGVAQALKAQNRVPFEWTEAMVDARSAICELHDGDAPNVREWALPVLYVRGVDLFCFERPRAHPEPDAPTHRTRARILAEWIRTVGQGHTEDERRAVMESALKDVPKEYWPQLDGSFGNP